MGDVLVREIAQSWIVKKIHAGKFGGNFLMCFFFFFCVKEWSVSNVSHRNPTTHLAQDAIGTRLYDLQIPTLGNFCNAELQVSYKGERL